jgi:hypothetical protein
VVELTKLKVSLSMRDIYEGLEFRPKPKLVQTSDDEPEQAAGSSRRPDAALRCTRPIDQRSSSTRDIRNEKPRRRWRGFLVSDY